MRYLLVLGSVLAALPVSGGELELRVNKLLFSDPSAIEAVVVNQTHATVVLPGRYPWGALLEELKEDGKWRAGRPSYCGTANPIDIGAGTEVGVDVLWWLTLGYPDSDAVLAKPADPARRTVVPASKFPRTGDYRLRLEYRLPTEEPDDPLRVVYSLPFRIVGRNSQ